MSELGDTKMPSSGQSFITTIRVNDPGYTTGTSNYRTGTKPLSNGAATMANGAPGYSGLSPKQIELNSPVGDGERFSPSVVVLPPESPRSMTGSLQGSARFSARGAPRYGGEQQPHFSRKKFCSFLLAFGFLASLICLICMSILYHYESVSKSPETERVKILSTFNLKYTPENSKMKISRQTDINENNQYYLLMKDDVITWSSPSLDTTLTWFRGDSVKIDIIRNDSTYITATLGDPLTDKEASHQMNIGTTDHVALRLSRGKTHALISAWFSKGKDFKWTKHSKESLLGKFPKKKAFIEKFAV